MTDFAALLQPDRGQPARTIHLVDKKTAEQWIKAQSEARRALIEAARFDGKTGYQFLILPGVGSAELEVVSAVANVERLSPWCLAKLAEALPAGAYRLAEGREPGPALSPRQTLNLRGRDRPRPRRCARPSYPPRRARRSRRRTSSARSAR